MSYSDNLKPLQKSLQHAGYEIIREPWDISSLVKGQSVIDCEIIARKDYFNILYLEAQSNWKGISTDIAKKNENACLVITRYGDSHYILSTMKDHNTLHAKPRHLVLDIRSNPKLLNKFMQSLTINNTDDYVKISQKIHFAFDTFAKYDKAIKEFSENLSSIIHQTRDLIDHAIIDNEQYVQKAKKLLKMCQEIINDKMTMDDIKSMLIQHILTYKIFELVYDVQNFHKTNTVAKSLESLKNSLHISNNTINYETIELIAESITDVDQRQEFIKKIYETFYEKYDPAQADRDGIVYTPTEVVSFMLKSCNQLLKRHFNKNLSDNGVVILDPATGTGTFLVQLLKEIDRSSLDEKYKNEIHANEMSILPYYIAALNIEHTYQDITGKYKEFENICWMDTLDIGIKNFDKMTSYMDEFNNVKRISRQQKSKIHIIIGNPPYRAGQDNANHANKSKQYPHIDKKIEKDYVQNSSARKHKSHDMYKRFLKWASDRIDGYGMVVFVSNNSFLNAREDDGLRKSLYEEFNYIYSINLKGNARTFGEERRRQKGNIFHDKVKIGISVSFFIKVGTRVSEIYYTDIPDYMTSEQKLEYLNKHSMLSLKLNNILPDKNGIWVNQTNNNFNNLVPILPRNTSESIFITSTMGVSTSKDEWVYDFNKQNLKKKMKYYISFYNHELKRYQNEHTIVKDLDKWVTKKIKWSDKTLFGIQHAIKLLYCDNNIKPTLYRPFVIKYQYHADIITHRLRSIPIILSKNKSNKIISFSNPSTNMLFTSLASNQLMDSHSTLDTQCLPLFVSSGDKFQSNITGYALNLFREHYNDENITELDIFNYVYAIFNDPKYAQKYKYDLQRNYPRIPLTPNFRKWCKLGEKLFDLHANFINQKEYDLSKIKTKISNTPHLITEKNKNSTLNNQIKYTKLTIDNTVSLNIPNIALEYKIKSKSPLEWILEFYKESKNMLSKKCSDDDEICKKFSMYKFNDHKDEVIALLKKVTTVCIETTKIHKQLESMEWGPQPDLKFTPISKDRNSGLTRTRKPKSRKKPASWKPKKRGLPRYTDGPGQTTL